MLLTKNEMKAVKLVFTVIRRTLKISKVKDVDFDACDVDLQSVLVWAIREQQLYGCDKEEMEFNIKLDGRPLGGMQYRILNDTVSIDYLLKSLLTCDLVRFSSKLLSSFMWFNNNHSIHL